MRNKYNVLMAVLVGVLIWPGSALAQSELIVECQDPNSGEVIPNALRDAIVQDESRPADRVYVLRRGALCYNIDTINNTGFHLRIIGRTEPEPGQIDYGPPVIQMIEQDGAAARMLTGNNDLTIKNVWITGQGDNGSTTSYHPIQFDGSGYRIVFDNMIFERNNFHIMGVTGANNKVYITNSIYRNFINTTQQWEGRGIRFEAGADTLVMENNTFLNIGHTVIQSEARPIQYVRFVHNTLINVGRTINSGGIWKEAFFANNLGVNVGWHGEDEGDFSVDRTTTHTGLFTVGELPPQFGTDLERRVVFANNGFWRDPQLETYYNADNIIAQPLFNSGLRDNAPPTARTTQDFFDDLHNFVAEDNLWQINPNLVSYTEAPQVDQFPQTSMPLSQLVPKMIETMQTLRSGGTTPNWNDAWLWDPGRDPLAYDAGGFVYPLPEDLSYTNETLRTAGTDGLPLGDLNWFPTAKTDWEANRTQYIAEIENKSQAEEVDIVAQFEAEEGTVEGSAEIQSVEGQTWYVLNAGAYVEWEFDIPEEKEYKLIMHTNLAGRGTSGVDFALNGTNIFDVRGWGQYVFEPAYYSLPNNEWIEYPVMQDSLNANSDGALTLPAGPNTLRITNSWAENTMWAGFDVVDPSNDQVVVSLRAPQAVAQGMTPGCGEGVDFCSSGFRHVALQAGGSVSINLELPQSGEYLLRLFTDGAGSLRVLVDDAEVVSAVAVTEGAGSVMTDRFSASQGVRKITVSGVSGDVNLDWFQIIGVGIGTSSDRHELPEGFALEQNYPNPFNPSTTIQYEMGTAGPARIMIYDVLGRHVRTLVDGDMPAGVHHITWDGRAADGATVASGVYLYRLEAGGAFKVRTMVMLK